MFYSAPDTVSAQPSRTILALFAYNPIDMARLLRILLILLLFPPILAIILGWLVAPSFLHPVRRPLTPDLIQQADASFATIPAHREEMDVRAPDGVLLRGWKVRAQSKWFLDPAVPRRS
jgi:hypothetical protein